MCLCTCCLGPSSRLCAAVVVHTVDSGRKRSMAGDWGDTWELDDVSYPSLPKAFTGKKAAKKRKHKELYVTEEQLAKPVKLKGFAGGGKAEPAAAATGQAPTGPAASAELTGSGVTKAKGKAKQKTAQPAATAQGTAAQPQAPQTAAAAQQNGHKLSKKEHRELKQKEADHQQDSVTKQQQKQQQQQQPKDQPHEAVQQKKKRKHQDAQQEQQQQQQQPEGRSAKQAVAVSWPSNPASEQGHQKKQKQQKQSSNPKQVAAPEVKQAAAALSPSEQQVHSQPQHTAPKQQQPSQQPRKDAQQQQKQQAKGQQQQQQQGKGQQQQQAGRRPSLIDKMRSKLAGGRFRQLNEALYTRPGDAAFDMMQQQPELFEQYHNGFKEQVASWPLQPQDAAITWVKGLPKSAVVADFGCGDARLAASVPQKVHSLDLVASAPGVIACNMASTPLKTASCDAAVFSLALMGTDYGGFLQEAGRVVKEGGYLWIAEVRSRFISKGSGADSTKDFVLCMKQLGFKLQQLDASNKMFIILVLHKQGPPRKDPARIAWPTLEACLYKRR